MRSSKLAVSGGPALSPNGRWLAYQSDETGRDVGSLPREYAVSADGERFFRIDPAAVLAGNASPRIFIVQNWFEELRRLVPVD